MTRKIVGFIIMTVLVCAVFAQPITNGAAFDLKSGAVYVLTNQTSNAVATFDRAPDGTLTSVGQFSTDGSGNPVAQPGDPPTDPLASQGALILSDNNKFLFAVNAGSNEISVLAIGKDDLTLVECCERFRTRLSNCSVLDRDHEQWTIRLHNEHRKRSGIELCTRFKRHVDVA